MLLDCLQRDKFFEYRDWVIIQLLIDTGMRCGECLLIKMEDIDFRKNAILLPAENTKGKKDRYVFFSAQMEKQLRDGLPIRTDIAKVIICFARIKERFCKLII